MLGSCPRLLTSSALPLQHHAQERKRHWHSLRATCCCGWRGGSGRDQQAKEEALGAEMATKAAELCHHLEEEEVGAGLHWQSSVLARGMEKLKLKLPGVAAALQTAPSRVLQNEAATVAQGAAAMEGDLRLEKEGEVALREQMLRVNGRLIAFLESLN